MIATFFYNTTRTVAVIATCFLLLASQCAGPVGDDPQCLEAAMRPASFFFGKSVGFHPSFAPLVDLWFLSLGPNT